MWRSSLRLCVLFALCMATAWADKPNIIFILSDDLGYGDLGCYGQKMIHTPNLDKMAAEGLLFTQAYAGNTVCAPSRSTLMTGQDGGHTRVRANAVVPLRPEDVTVAKVLKGVGYHTILLGKWGLGAEGSTGVPTKQGFDSFFGYLDQVRAHNHFPSWLWQDETKVPIEGNDEKSRGVCGSCKVYADDLFTDKAIDFIGGEHKEPYFLYLSEVVPHANNEKYAVDHNGMEVPDWGEYADKDWPETQKGQAAMITRMDGYVGRILDKIKQTGQDKNTLVLFSSDNGPLQEGGGDSFFFNSSGPLQGFKRSLHDGGIRVPLIAWWPGHIAPGGDTGQVCAFWDMLPTFAELAGAAPPAGIDGISLVPTLLGQPGQKQHDYLYWEFHEQGFEQALRSGHWKALRPQLGDIALYDLDTDIHEDHDIAADYPDVVAEMKKRFESARTESEEFPIRVKH